jgi:hypothetical protein
LEQRILAKESVVSRLTNASRGRFAKVIAGTLALVLLAACETGPVYKPRAPGEVVGYTDQQLTPNRYRVTFSGSNATEREDVENYLLRRAAEVTLAAGYTHFVFDARDTVARTTYRQAFGDPWFYDPFYGPRAYYWSSWPYSPYGFGHPYWYGDLRSSTRFSAYSEIVMMNAAEAAGNPRAVDAQSLLQRLPPPDAPTTAQSDQAPRG